MNVLNGKITMSGKKCKYRRTSYNEQWIPDCCVEFDEEGNADPFDSVHPDDVEKGDYCSNCGKKIKFKEFSSIME